MSASQDYFDAVLRHQIGLRRFASGEVKRLLRLLDSTQDDLEAQLIRLLRKHATDERTYAIKRVRKELQEVLAARQVVLEEIKGEHIAVSEEQAVLEGDFERRLLQDSLPIEIAFAAVPTETLRALVTSKPFQGDVLKNWWSKVSRSDQERIERELMIGMVEGQTVDEIVRRIVGSEAGAIFRTRRDVEAVVRTAIIHVSSAAREEVWKANDDVVQALMWNSTLDGRTTAICRARDNHFAPLYPGQEVPEPRLTPPGARPPAHFGCRSVMVVVFDVDGIVRAMGERPFVRDTRTRRMRERDFRKEARDVLGGRPSKDAIDDMSRRLRKQWVAENVGRVSADMSYGEWLKRQPTAFQNDVMGQKKAQLFRKGLPIDKFVDEDGRELTLNELKARYPKQWDETFR